MPNKRIIVFFLIILLLGILSLYYPQFTGNIIKIPENNYQKEPAILIRVVDGDTIHALVNGKDETIRLLGINTPEKGMPFSENAASFLKKFENKTILLERDFEDKDKYYRKLRYVFYENRFLNLEIVENGFANAYYYHGLIYENQFINAEKQARTLEQGIWKKSNNICASCIILKELNSEAEFFTIENICSFECNLAGWFVKDAGRNTFELSNLAPKTKSQHNSSKGKEVWNNEGDKFFMFDEKGYLVIYYVY